MVYIYFWMVFSALVRKKIVSLWVCFQSLSYSNGWKKLCGAVYSSARWFICKYTRVLGEQNKTKKCFQMFLKLNRKFFVRWHLMSKFVLYNLDSSQLTPVKHVFCPFVNIMFSNSLQISFRLIWSRFLVFCSSLV